MITITKECEELDLRPGGFSSVFTVVKVFGITVLKCESYYIGRGEWAEKLN